MATSEKKRLSEMTDEEIDKLSDEEYEKLWLEEEDLLREEKLRKYFDTADKDKDGQITGAEFAEVVFLQPNFGDREQQLYLKQLIVQKLEKKREQGENIVEEDYKISFEELKEYVKKLYEE